MILIKDLMLSLFEVVKGLGKSAKMVMLGVIMLGVVVVTMMAAGIGFSYDVIYNGERVGRISELTALGEAKRLATLSVAHTKDSSFEIAQPEIRYTFSFTASDTTVEELTDAMVNNTKDVIKGYSVVLGNGKTLYVKDKAVAEKVIAEYCSAFDISGLKCESNLETPAVYTAALLDDSVLCSEEQIKTCIMGLDVVTVANKVTEYSVPYETLTTRTSKKYTGYVAVTTAGVKGVSEKIEKITYKNGVQTASEFVSDNVVTEPINEVVVVGTGKSSYSTVIHNASTKGYIWPISYKGVITSYWGDGRGHKGIDIAAKGGTDIYAVKAGKVTFAGWNGDYGYNVIIDHGNGVQTRYAHSRKLHVKAGEQVSQGQVIAEVGTTGQSTGNHLHFEVIINGQRVNPAPYLGI